MRRSLSHRSGFIITASSLLVIVTVVFSIMYRALGARVEEKFFRDLSQSVLAVSESIEMDLESIESDIERLIGFISGKGSALKEDVLFPGAPVRDSVALELFSPEGYVIRRYYRSAEYEALMNLSAEKGGVRGVKVFPARGKLYALFRYFPASEEGYSLNVLTELDPGRYTKGMREKPLMAALADRGEFVEVMGDGEDMCAGCHSTMPGVSYFIVPHPGFVKKEGYFLSGAVGGRRYALVPLTFRGGLSSHLVFAFSEERLATAMSEIQALLFPSWLCTVLFGLVGLSIFYGNLSRPLKKMALFARTEGEGIDAVEGEDLPDEVAPILDRMRELRERLMKVRDEFEEERGKLESELARHRHLGEGVVEKIQKINEFIHTISTIMYPEVLGERIVWEVLRLTSCHLVLLAVEGTGTEREAEVFTAHTFRKDSVTEIFLKKMEKEFESYSGRVREVREFALIDDPFFSRFSIYNHKLERVLVMPIEVRDVRLGSIAFFRKGSEKFMDEDIEYISVFATHLGTAIENSKLHEEVKKNYFNTIRALVNAIEEKDRYTRGHSERVTRISVAMGEKAGLSRKRLRILYQAAVLHDIGKIGIDLTILNKRGKLNDDEYNIIREHPVIGQRIIEPLTFLREVKACIREHHERYDGKGYPQGLKRDELTLEGKILAVADAFDAMTSDRPYRKAMTDEEAIRELQENAGSQFDPYVVELFIKVYDEMKTAKVKPNT